MTESTAPDEHTIANDLTFARERTSPTRSPMIAFAPPTSWSL